MKAFMLKNKLLIKIMPLKWKQDCWQNILST